MKHDCGCCEGTEPLTPVSTANRPGLDAIRYRVGTYASFLETMKARLSSMALPAGEATLYPLKALTTRAGDDPAIALLHGWASVGDVLTFYQERIANEGYLRTAQERRSLIELARLVGYRPRPGVAASVYLAFELERTHKEEVEIPAGTRAQSLPEPGELPQAFETSEPLHARVEWNALRPRLTRPQALAAFATNEDQPLYLQGTGLNLSANDPLVFASPAATLFVRKVASVEVQTAAERTKVTLQAVPAPRVAVLPSADRIRTVVATHADLERFALSPGATTDRVLTTLGDLSRTLEAEPLEVTVARLESEILPRLRQERADAEAREFERLEPWLASLTRDLERALRAPAPTEGPVAPRATAVRATGAGGQSGSLLLNLAAQESQLLTQLAAPPSVQPANATRLARSVGQTFDLAGDTALRVIGTVNAAWGRQLYTALRGAAFVPPQTSEVHVLRSTAAPFGYNAPRVPDVNPDTGAVTGTHEQEPARDEASNVLFLDQPYEAILPGNYVTLQRPDRDAAQLFQVVDVRIHPRTAYGISGKTTRLTLNGEWWDPNAPRINGDGDGFGILRGTAVYVESERLPLAEAPVRDALTAEAGLDYTPISGREITLDGLYNGLEPGRWLVVAGERADLDGTAGVRASELVMIASVEQRVDATLPGDTPHTTVILANDLAYVYKRETVGVYANVVRATHGETRNEVLGSGDGSRAMQQFTLKQHPLTYVPAPTPSGVASTLEVRVNDVRWPEVDNLFELGPDDRGYVTRRDEDEKTTVMFGDGTHGTRLPTSPENVRATYRNGIGKGGNVRAEQISLLMTRPLGVQGVINPLAASGGADAEREAQIRENTPLAVTALDRLVSVLDYADFARTFAGIGKASAALLSDGRRQVVHVTIAGADDIPIAANSDLYRNLRQALHDFGDPALPVELATRELMLLLVQARVRVHPDYEWETVEPSIRATLLEGFGFGRRALGQDVLLSEVIAAVQHVPGVAYADVDLLDSISETEASDVYRLIQKLDDLTRPEKNSAGAPPRARIAVQPARYEPDGLHAAQLAILSPDLPEMLLLEAIE